MTEQYQDCTHSVFNKLWGEIKCKKRSHVIQDPINTCNQCEYYKKDPHKVIDISEDE